MVRRKDREIKDTYGIREIIWSATAAGWLFQMERAPTLYLPASDTTREENAPLFPRAAEGKKMDLVRQTGYAGFEMDTAHGLKTADQACGYSFRYRSVVGRTHPGSGGDTGKEKGLNCIMGHMSGERTAGITRRLCLRRTAVLQPGCGTDVRERTGLGRL